IVLGWTITYVFVHYFLAIHRHTFLYPLGVFLGAEVVAIAWRHESIPHILSGLTVTSLSLCLTMAVLYYITPPSAPIDTPQQTDLVD
ncbi:MAG: hypothetical protein WD972_02505, partial [Candidatus Andersenbacteria bacterium]